LTEKDTSKEELGNGPGIILQPLVRTRWQIVSETDPDTIMTRIAELESAGWVPFSFTPVHDVKEWAVRYVMLFYLQLK